MKIRPNRLGVFALFAAACLSAPVIAQEATPPAPKPPENPTADPKLAPRPGAPSKEAAEQDAKDDGKFPTKMDVPADASKMGRVYYVHIPGGRRDRNLKLNGTLDGQKSEGYSRFVVGYAVTGPAENPAALKGAEFRVPVASIRLADKAFEGEIVKDAWLNGAKAPNISFKLKEVKDVKPQEGVKNPNVQFFGGTLVGDLSVRGVSKAIEFPNTKFRFLKESAHSALIGPGDLMFIEFKAKMKPADLGFSAEAVSAKKLGEEIEVMISATLTSVEPAADAPKKGEEKKAPVSNN